MSRNRKPRPRPEGAPEPQDFKAPASPAQREAESAAGDLIPFTWRGVKLFVPPADDWHPINVKGPLAAGNVIGAVYHLLNPAQMGRIAQALPDFKTDDYYELFQAITKAAGFGNAGN